MGAIFWLIAMAVFAILEIAIPALITIWMAVASLILAILTFIINDVKIELSIFLALSAILVYLTRPLAKAILNKKKFDSQMVGTEVKIVKVVEIENQTTENNQKIKGTYEVKFKGSIWTGISDKQFNVGADAKIKGFKGNKIVLE